MLRCEFQGWINPGSNCVSSEPIKSREVISFKIQWWGNLTPNERMKWGKGSNKAHKLHNPTGNITLSQESVSFDSMPHVYLCGLLGFTPCFSSHKMELAVWTSPKLSLYLCNPGFSETVPCSRRHCPREGFLQRLNPYIKVRPEALGIWDSGRASHHDIFWNICGGRQALPALVFVRPAEHTPSTWDSLLE